MGPSQASALAAEGIPGGETCMVPGGGHPVMEDAPGEVVQVLTGFFSGDGKARGGESPFRLLAGLGRGRC